MSLLLYGIVAGNTLPVDFDKALSFVNSDGLTAVVTRREEVSQDVESVLDFGKIVANIHQHTTIIPIRYGSLLPDETAVVQHLTEKALFYRQRLEELDGCEEMGIRLPMATPEPDPQPLKKPSSGHEYLTLLKRKYAATEQAEQEAAALDIALKGLFRKRSGEAGLFANQPMYLVSYLVHRTQSNAFRAKAEELFETGAHKCIISGPWPPYNFAG